MPGSINGSMNKILILPMLLFSLLLLSACSSEEKTEPKFDYASITLYEKTVSDTGLESSAPVKELFIPCRSGSEIPGDCQSLAALPGYRVREGDREVDLLQSEGECSKNPERNRRVLVEGQIDGEEIYSMVDLECSPERQTAFKELFPKLFSAPEATGPTGPKSSGSCGGMDMETGQADSGCLQTGGASFK
jgi:hypothetical protein